MENKELIEAIELTETGYYRDGGSYSYEDSKGNKYWRDFSITTKRAYPHLIGKIFKGDINDDLKLLASGKFKIKDGSHNHTYTVF